MRNHWTVKLSLRIEIIPKTGFFDYANKYQDGATMEVCPADIPEEVAERMKALTVKASMR